MQTSPYLTKADATAIANDVLADLKGRLAAQQSGGNPFETKSWGSAAVAAISPTEMDFADVPESGRMTEIGVAPF